MASILVSRPAGARRGCLRQEVLMDSPVNFGSTVKVIDVVGVGPMHIVDLWLHDEDGKHVQFSADLFDPADVDLLRCAWKDPATRQVVYLGARCVQPEFFDPF